MSYTRLRYDILYGPRMRSNMAIAIFVKKAIARVLITVFGDRSQGGCFIYVEDLAEGNIATLSEKAINQIINLAGREFITINRIVDELKKIVGGIEVIYEVPRLGDFKGTLVSIEKAKKMLSWELKTSFSEDLRKICNIGHALRPRLQV
ncbi:MAG: NAD-dependent epimerase/dehydratase family protein [Candidatus Baldrarchaeia archaeon]